MNPLLRLKWFDFVIIHLELQLIIKNPEAKGNTLSYPRTSIHSHEISSSFSHSLYCFLVVFSLFRFLRKVTSKNLLLVSWFNERKFCWKSAEIRLPYHLGSIYPKWLAYIPKFLGILSILIHNLNQEGTILYPEKVEINLQYKPIHFHFIYQLW